MTPLQAHAAGRLGGRAAGGLVAHVAHLHRSLAQRSFRPLAPVAAPVRLVHDGISEAVYATVRGALVASGTAAGVAARGALHLRGDDAGTTGATNHVLSALNAVIGHGLAAEGDPLAITMAVRSGGHDVDPSAEGLAAAFPDAGRKVAVFVHGLGENEQSWRLGGAGRDGATHGSRLQADLGHTPVYVRYNTGRHISDNGQDLADLLARLHRHWPVDIDELVLVGHSMGGLVIRSACHYGAEGAWVAAVRHVAYLGSPHTGAPLARTARAVGWVLDKLPETKPYGSALDHSPGVRDLRFGYIVEDDWAGCDGGTCRDDHRGHVPLLATCDHYVISAAVAAEPRSRAARVVGDLLVQPSSAHGRRADRPPLELRPEHRHHHPRLHHLDLLNHPAVYDTLRAWLEGSPDR